MAEITIPVQGTPNSLGDSATYPDPKTESGLAWNKVIVDGKITQEDKAYILYCCGDFSASEVAEIFAIADVIFKKSRNASNIPQLRKLGDIAFDVGQSMKMARTDYNAFYLLFIDAVD